MGIQTLKEATDELAGRDDRQLIAACLEGDHAAWEALITRYQRLIYSIPIKLRLSQDDAADVFQSVCLKLYEKLSTLRDHEKISAWLITTTTRECWRLAALSRREGRTTTGFEDETGSVDLDQIPAAALLPDEQRMLIERQQMVRTALGALSERCRRLLTMLFYQKNELSYADIARRMSMPVPSVGPTRARCLEKLKKILQVKF
jgi:RNA polymerase sigma factor (sigma-70 family)